MSREAHRASLEAGEQKSPHGEKEAAFQSSSPDHTKALDIFQKDGPHTETKSPESGRSADKQLVPLEGDYHPPNVKLDSATGTSGKSQSNAHANSSGDEFSAWLAAKEARRKREAEQAQQRADQQEQAALAMMRERKLQARRLRKKLDAERRREQAAEKAAVRRMLRGLQRQKKVRRHREQQQQELARLDALGKLPDDPALVRRIMEGGNARGSGPSGSGHASRSRPGARRDSPGARGQGQLASVAA